MPEAYEILNHEDLQCQPQEIDCPCMTLVDGETKTCTRCGDTVTKIFNPDKPYPEKQK